MTLLAWNTVRSRIGRAFVAMRDSEIAAEALGVDLLRYKTMAFALSGFYAGVAGGLYCGLLNFVAPEGFDLFQMVIHKAMVVVGGLGSVVGSVIGATLLVVDAGGAARVQVAAGDRLRCAAAGLRPVPCRTGIVSFLRRVLPGWDEQAPSARAVGRSATPSPPASARAEPANSSLLSISDLSVAFGGAAGARRT